MRQPRRNPQARAGIAFVLALLLLGGVALKVLSFGNDTNCTGDSNTSPNPVIAGASAPLSTSPSSGDLYATLDPSDLVVLVSSTHVAESGRDGESHTVTFSAVVDDVLFTAETFNDPSIDVPPSWASAIAPGASLRFVEGGLAAPRCSFVKALLRIRADDYLFFLSAHRSTEQQVGEIEWRVSGFARLTAAGDVRFGSDPSTPSHLDENLTRLQAITGLNAVDTLEVALQEVGGGQPAGGELYQQFTQRLAG